MPCYYNDNDPGCCGWLRELIKANLVPDGEVDERSIADVRSEDLRGFTQCHFFCGIAGWPYALRLAGWPDDRPVWTGSCPCPPFSSAGKRKCCPICKSKVLVPHPFRTGVFVCCACNHEWFADGRHLWPEFRRLIEECRPATVFGEQVASEDGRIWLAGVRATLEILGYGVGASDLCAAGIGAPHIRQRIWWVADAGCECGEAVRAEPGQDQSRANIHDQRCGADGGLADADGARYQGPDRCGQPEQTAVVGACEIHLGGISGTCGLADAESGRGQIERCESARESDVERCGADGGLVHANATGSQGDRSELPRRGSEQQSAESGAWSDFDLVYCRDGKARRVEPGTFPLADGVPARVGRLRGYGNAIVPQVAAEFVKAYLGTVQ